MSTKKKKELGPTWWWSSSNKAALPVVYAACTAALIVGTVCNCILNIIFKKNYLNIFIFLNSCNVFILKIIILKNILIYFKKNT